MADFMNVNKFCFFLSSPTLYPFSAVRIGKVIFLPTLYDTKTKWDDRKYSKSLPLHNKLGSNFNYQLYTHGHTVIT